jgi:hypothetical protein
MQTALLVAAAATAWTAAALTADAICLFRLPHEAHANSTAKTRRRTDNVSVSNVLPILARFIWHAKKHGVHDDNISDYLHLSKESWGESRLQWLRGNEEHEGVAH